MNANLFSKNRIDHGTRWSVEYLAPGARRWVTLGTTGSQASASHWCNRFGASGKFRVQGPAGQGATR